MAYNKTTWANGDVITAQKLNNAENGIAANDEEITGLKDDLGDLSDLDTTVKTDLVSAINEVAQGGGGALTQDTKQALLQCFAHTAWTDDQGQDYYDDLEDALYPFDLLSSISAVYTQSGTVYDTDSLDSLKADLVVTGNYSDGTYNQTTKYTLSGTLTVGTSTITATYGGKTTTFTVTVTQSTAVLTSISAVYTQSGTVYDTDSLDSLKTDLVVTAHYSDSSTATVASTDYTLSGTLTAGTSTVTVTYSGFTTTFSVTVTAHGGDPAEDWTNGVAYTPTIIQNEYYVKATGAVASYNGWDRTDYMPCKGAEIIDVSTLPQQSGDPESNVFVDDNFSPVKTGVILGKAVPVTILVPSGAAYLGVSSESAALQSCVSNGITPYAPKTASNMSGWADGVAYANLTIVPNSYVEDGTIKPYTGWDRTDYVPCNGLASITFPPLPQSQYAVDYCFFYKKDKSVLVKFRPDKTQSTTITVPRGAYWFIISSESAAVSSCVSGGIVPHTS